MPKFLTDRWHGKHMIWALVVAVLLVAALSFYQWILGLVGAAVLAGLVYYTVKAERAFRRDLREYVMTLSHRVKKAGSDVIQEMPIGMILYNEHLEVEWHNRFVADMYGQSSLIGESVMRLIPDWNGMLNGQETEIQHGEAYYRVQQRPDDRLIYLTDVTQLTLLREEHESRKLAIGIVMMDNAEEASQGMDDQARSMILARIVSEINEWAKSNHLYLRRVASDKFLFLTNQKGLHALEQSKFVFLDQVREMTHDLKIPFTISIGAATGVDDLVELGELAQTSLDIVLGRGGDQAAVKVGDRLTFYGGKSGAVEKGTRVRSRVISHALRELIKESDKVLIMGHRFPDMDSIGAAVGILRLVKMYGKNGYIVLDKVNPSIHNLMNEIRKHEYLDKWFITPEQALQIVSSQSLAVVVDTHKASMAEEPKLLELTNRIFIVDHHRRGEEFINEATLVYMEPYASSASELVTELIQYSQERVKMENVEATALLAGIVVDTKSFSLRTGSRTFEAASFLRRHGADSALIQSMLKEDLESFTRKAEIVKHAEILYDHIAVAAAEPDREHTQLLIAQSADMLLNMNDILASFVVARRPDGKVGISARSLGKINVQMIMERFGGGGHFSNAAAQLEGDVELVADQLKQVIHEIHEEEGLPE